MNKKQLRTQWKNWNTKLQTASKNFRKAKTYKTKIKYSKQQTTAFIKLTSLGKKINKK